MLSEEIHASGVADKIVAHEDAAHEKRNWVRLTYECNNRCTFCLDSDTHNGEMRDREEIKTQILEGRTRGAARLILSGGEPTIHPHFIDFVRLGRLAGYRKVQTVTNGRLFGYPLFLKKAVEAGLSEITFSLHGPNARIHDALVGVPGAFEQESRGLKAALTDGRVIVNVDIVINKGNVKHLPEMLELFTSWGVKEFDLLQVVPFGRAFTEGRTSLFYDLEEMRPYLLEAFAYSKRPDLHIWLNRFPPQHLEGYEKLIQDPYKLNDEVRGRKEEFARLLNEGVDLDCRDPARCKYCYLEKLCDTLYATRDAVETNRFERLRVDTQWESRQEPVFGGDPASARRAKAEAAAAASTPVPDGRGGFRLPVVSARNNGLVSFERRAEDARARALWVRAPTLQDARAAVERFTTVSEIELELDSYDGLAAALTGDAKLFGARTLTRAIAANVAHAQELLAIASDFEVQVLLDRDTAAWLLALESPSPRLTLKQPSYERLTESAERDVDLRDFFSRFTAPVKVEGVPACITGRAPVAPTSTFDTSMAGPDGAIEIFRYTKRFILEHYRTKSLRCKGCVHVATCPGLHINHVRAHGYGAMQPVAA
jgi:MoaA/NifB/PqqE/SkfB family radical SAM enzyme